MKTLKFKSWTGYLETSTYRANNRLALLLVDPNDEELICNISVNVPSILDFPEDHIAVKNYSENEGILDVLIEANVVDKPTSYVQSGFVKIPICKLNMDVAKQFMK